MSALLEMPTNYTHDAVVARIEREQKLSHEEAVERFRECLKFLALCAVRPEKSYVPSALVDEAWHDFVLFTRDYHNFCEERLGGFVHHDPTDSPDLDGYEATRQALLETFGELNLAVWPAAKAGSCSGSCNSGSCKSVGSCSGSCNSGSCKSVGSCSGSCNSGSCKSIF